MPSSWCSFVMTNICIWCYAKSNACARKRLCLPQETRHNKRHWQIAELNAHCSLAFFKVFRFASLIQTIFAFNRWPISLSKPKCIFCISYLNSMQLHLPFVRRLFSIFSAWYLNLLIEQIKSKRIDGCCKTIFVCSVDLCFFVNTLIVFYVFGIYLLWF